MTNVDKPHIIKDTFTEYGEKYNYTDYLGNINLIEGQSAGAPGMSHYICPINKTFNLKKKIFDIDPVLIKK